MKLKQTELLIATGRATARDFDGMEYADVAQIKAGVPLQMRGMTGALDEADLGAEGAVMLEAVRARADVNGDRLVAYVMSTEDQDRMGDVIRVFGGTQGKGWQLEEYEANPVFLWSHESWNPPIGITRAIWQGRIRQGGVVKNALVGIVEFYDADTNAFADFAFKLVGKGGMGGSSVGFMPVDVVEYPSQAQREAAGLGKYGVEFVTQTLLEDSLAVVPANPFALATGLKSLLAAGELDDSQADEFAKTYCLTERDHRKALVERLRSVVDMGAARGVSIQRSIRGRAGDVLKQAALDGDGTARIIENARKGLDTVRGTVQDAEDRGAAVVTMSASQDSTIFRIPGKEPIEVPKGHSLSFEDGELKVTPPAEGAPEGGDGGGETQERTDGAPDPADMLASEERAVVKTALEGLYDSLADAQGMVGRALDLLEQKAAPDDAEQRKPDEVSEIKTLLAEVRAALGKIKDASGEEPQGPEAERRRAAPDGAADDFDPAAAKELVAKFANDLKTCTTT